MTAPRVEQLGEKKDGRVAKATGLSPEGEAAEASSSQSDFDPSRGPLVLSLFPGIGLLDMAFEEAGFCVVRGPDLLWGGDVRLFRPPAGRFDGVIGGPPCQFASEMSRFNAHLGRALAENRIPDFERIVSQTGAAWFVMENVIQAPAPEVPGYTITQNILRDVWCGGETMRQRRMSIGSRRGLRIHVVSEALHRPDPEIAITSGAREDRQGRMRHVVSGKLRVCSTRGARLPLDEMARRQGLPPHFFGDDSPFTDLAKRKMIGNGVPLAMGRAVAAAVVRALASGIEARSAGIAEPGPQGESPMAVRPGRPEKLSDPIPPPVQEAFNV